MRKLGCGCLGGHRLLRLIEDIEEISSESLSITCNPMGFWREKFSGGRLMRKRPTEIHLNVHDLALSHSKQFGVPESLAVIQSALVGYKRFLLAYDNLLEVKRGHSRAVRPAALEIGSPANPVVQRTGEVKIFADERFNRRPVLVDITLE